MAGTIRISEPALRWLTEEAERIAANFGETAGRDFQARIDDALTRLLAFPEMTARGKIPGTRTLVVNRRTLLTIIFRDGDLIVASARSHFQSDEG